MQFQTSKKPSIQSIFNRVWHKPYSKSKLLLICLISLITFHLSGQSRTQSPQWEVRFGVGLLPTFLKDHAKSELQPTSLEIRYLLNRKFSLGLLAGNSISSASQEHHTGEVRLVRNDFRMLAIRGAVHSYPFKKWKVYGGMVLGYSHSQVTYQNAIPGKNYEADIFPQTPQCSGLFFSGFIGTQYHLRRQVNVFGELGYGLSLATMGIALCF